jgi:hypothetical protein
MSYLSGSNTIEWMGVPTVIFVLGKGGNEREEAH